MSCRRLVAIAVLFFSMAFQGCAFNPVSVPKLPDQLVGQGLMVARLYVPGSALWENAQVDIDGRRYAASLRDGYIAIALDPGKHTFNHLRIEGHHNLTYNEPAESAIRKVRSGGGGGHTYYYVPGGTYTIYFTTLAVNRSFTVEANKIVNLGLIVYLPADDPNKLYATTDGKKDYYTFNLDNSAEIRYYLETNYPKLIASLKDRSARLESGKYLDASKLSFLRQQIGANAFRNRKVIGNSTITVAYGDAGTMMLAKEKDGKPTFNVLDTGTLANIVDATRDGERLIFLTADAKLLSIEQETLTQTQIPNRIHPVRLDVVSGGRLALVDNRMRLLLSNDRGQTWSTYEGAMIDEPRSDIGMISYKEDAYIYVGRRGLPNLILRLKSGESMPVSIKPPMQESGPTDSSYNSVLLRDAGMFVVLNGRNFYFRSHHDTKWRQYTKPGDKCDSLRLDNTGRNLKIECDGMSYESSNSGAQWKKGPTV